MLKYLFLLALVALVWRLWKKQPRARATENSRLEKPFESMVACARCGVYLPESDALQLGGRFYCGEGRCVSGRPPAAS